MIDYRKRLAEVSVILNHLSKENYDKIPKELIEKIEENKDTEYIWKYDETKVLKYQNLSRDTIAILSYININYLLNEEQKRYARKILNKNQNKVEESKKNSNLTKK